MRKITTDSLNWFWKKGILPIKEKVENIINVIETTVKIAEIVNNCVTDNPDLPLSAAQGKFLMDQITGLYSDMDDAIVYSSNVVLIETLTPVITNKYAAITLDKDSILSMRAIVYAKTGNLPVLIFGNGIIGSSYPVPSTGYSFSVISYLTVKAGTYYITTDGTGIANIEVRVFRKNEIIPN